MKKILISICLVAIAAGTVSAANYKGDINRDGKVDLADMALVATAINSGNSDKTLHDINGSGVVDDADLDALADIILSEKLTEDTGLNIGIGGWGDGGEFGGVVTSPGMSRSVESTQFFLDGPKYDFDRNSSYMEFGIEGTPSAVSGILFNMTVPEELDFEAGKFVQLYERSTGHRLYGKPVVTNAGNDRRIRFIVFSNTLEELPTERTVLGRIYPLADVDNYFGHSFLNCQTIARGATRSVVVPEHGAYVNWSFCPVTGITLNETSIEMQVDGEMTLYATISPDNAKNRDLRWSSDNTDVVTVDGYGTIHGVSVGEATVTATAADGSGVSASCRVKVNPVLVNSIELDITEKELIIGEIYQLNASVSPDNATDNRVVWSCDNPDVATVDENGVITAVSVGEATVTVTAADGSGVSASCRVKVNPVLVRSIELDVNDISLRPGGVRKLIATVMPDNATDKRVVWRSDNDGVASVDESGNVTAVSQGEAIITATSTDDSGAKAECIVRVLPPLATSIVLDRNEIEMTIGDEATVTARMEPANAEMPVLVWSSADETVAKVADGVITATGIGETTITVCSADDETLAAHCHVKVNPVFVTSIELDVSSVELAIGESVTLHVTILPENATDKRVSWSSDDIAAAVVDDEGKVTITGAGSTVIRVATLDGSNLEATCMVLGLSGLMEVIDDSEPADIFSITGTLIVASVPMERVHMLEPGTYIIRQCGRTYKVVIR